MANEEPAAPTSPAQHLQEVSGIALSMRVPPFWRDRPRLWFISFEAATSELKKSEAQKAQMVIAQLEKEDIEQICDLLYEPPAERYYSIIKERLISVYEESDGKQLQKLLSDMDLGDQKPSQLLRRMRTLARNKVPDSTLRLMWMNLLPPHVHSVIIVSNAISNDTALDELAKLADKMLEQNRQVSTIASVSSSTRQGKHVDIQFLADEIRKLHLEVAELRAFRNNYSYPRPPPHARYHYAQQHPHRNARERNTSRSPSPSRNRDGPSRSRSATPSPFCYYHRRFGKNAKRCTTPCTFNNEETSEN